jgi:iron complex outermembrane receptor protein
MQIVIVRLSIQERKRIMQVQSLFQRGPLPVLLLAGLSAAGFANAQEAAPVHGNSVDAPEYRLNNPASSETVLPEVKVQAGSAFAETLPPVYAGGQVARGGRVGLLGNKDVMDTPFSVTSYTSQVMEDQQARTLADVLANDPSIRSTTSTGHGFENFNMRGFNVYFTDTAFNGLYGLSPSGHVPLEMFERVEVLRGPSALLSGMAPTGAISGAINMVSKYATEQPVTRLTASWVDEAQFGAHLDVGRRFGTDKTFGIRVNGAFRDGKTGVEGQSKRRELGAAALDYQGKHLRVFADVYAVTNAQRGGNVFMAVFTPSMSVPRPPSGDTNVFRGAYNRVHNKAVMGRVEYDLNEAWMVYLTAGSHEYLYRGTLNGSHAPLQQSNGDFTASHSFARGYSDTDVAETGIRGNFMTGSARHEIVLSANSLFSESGAHYGRGGIFQSNIYHPARPILADNPGPPPKTEEAALTSLALADTLGFAEDRLLLTLGVREQRVRTKGFNSAGARTSEYDERALTPALGVVFKPWQGVSIYANYIEGLSKGGTVTDVNAPNYNEVFAPYKSKQTEIGLKWDSGRFLNTLSLFQITKPSMIQDAATLAYSDDGKQRNRGVEWTTAGEIARGVRLLGGASYTEATLTRATDRALEGKDVYGVPRWTANLGAEWDTPWLAGLTLSGRLTYTGRHYANNANTLTLPGFTLADIGVRYATSINGREVVLRGSVNNVFDKHYWLGGFYDNYVQLGEARTFMFSATVDF